MAQRIKGQETKAVFTSPDGLEEGMADCTSFESEIDMEILEEGYLGETANRFDSIYNGSGGNIEFHVESSSALAFIDKLKDRAQRRSAASGQFNVVSAMAFPNGTRARILYEDVHFGAVPIRIPSRKDYVTLRFEWKCTNYRRIG
jgi:hypothetical protein